MGEGVVDGNLVQAWRLALSRARASWTHHLIFYVFNSFAFSFIKFDLEHGPRHGDRCARWRLPRPVHVDYLKCECVKCTYLDVKWQSLKAFIYFGRSLPGGLGQVGQSPEAPVQPLEADHHHAVQLCEATRIRQLM